MMTRHPKNPHVLMRTSSFDPGCLSSDAKVASHSDVGGYPIFYITKDCGALCPDCVQSELEDCVETCPKCQDPQWLVVGHGTNWEDPTLYCDHCSDRIESAYAEEEAEEIVNQEVKSSGLSGSDETITIL